MTLELICYPEGFKDCEGRDLSGTYTLLENGKPTLQFKSLQEYYEFEEERNLREGTDWYAKQAQLDHMTEMQDGHG